MDRPKARHVVWTHHACERWFERIRTPLFADVAARLVRTASYSKARQDREYRGKTTWNGLELVLVVCVEGETAVVKTIWGGKDRVPPGPDPGQKWTNSSPGACA